MSLAGGPSGVPCSPSDVDGDCCSAAGFQEESRFGFSGALTGNITSRDVECLNGGVNVCEDGIDNDGDGLADAEDPECSTLYRLQRDVVAANDASARHAVQFGGKVSVRHAESDGASPAASEFWMKAVCTEGMCACPDSQIDAAGMTPGVARPACQTLGQACLTDRDCLPGPYPAKASWAGVCGASLYMKREPALEGDVATMSNARFGHAQVGGTNARLLADLGSDFFCNGCIEQQSSATPPPFIDFDGAFPWLGPGVCLPSGLKSCYRDEDCCAFPNLTTCVAPAQPGDICHGRRQMDFLAPMDPLHNVHMVRSGGSGNPGNPNGFDTCSAALIAIDELDDPLNPLNLGATNLPGTAYGAINIPGKGSASINIGSGTTVLDIGFVRFSRNGTLTINGPSDAVLVARVHGRFLIGGVNQVNLTGGIAAHNVLWLMDAGQRPVFLSRDIDFNGTILAPRAKRIRLGGKVNLHGALLGRRVSITRDSVLSHRPFTALLPTNLEIAKSAAPAPQNIDAPLGAVVAGSNVQYTITVTNHGPSYAPGVVVQDPLPAIATFVSVDSVDQGNCVTPDVGSNGNVNCFLGTMAPGDEVIIVYTAKVNATAAAQTMSNTATVSGNIEDLVSDNDSATASIQVVRLVDMVVSNVGTPAIAPGPAPAVAGRDSVTYQWDVTNNGPSTANNVHVQANTPTGLTVTMATVTMGGGTCNINAGNVNCDLGTIGVGATKRIQIIATLGCATAASFGHTLAVSAVDETERASTAGNESATQTLSGILRSANLGITKSDNPDPVTTGSTLQYTLTATNGGPCAAPSAVVTDNFPAQLTSPTWTCMASGGAVCPSMNGSGNLNQIIATFPSGGQLVYAVSGGTVPPGSGSDVANTASVAVGATNTDLDPSNNSATEHTQFHTPTPLPVKRVFVTSTTQQGDLGGLLGGDAICATRAGAATLGGTWVAWLSATGTDAKDRIPNAEYRLVDGTTVIANNKADLIDGSLDNGITKNEFGTTISGTGSWTGTLVNGTASPQTCLDWSNATLGAVGTVGTATVSNQFWTNGGAASCNTNERLICFET